nr:hypothetical protein [Phenylobacterium sp.]
MTSAPRVVNEQVDRHGVGQHLPDDRLRADGLGRDTLIEHPHQGALNQAAVDVLKRQAGERLLDMGAVDRFLVRQARARLGRYRPFSLSAKYAAARSPNVLRCSVVASILATRHRRIAAFVDLYLRLARRGPGFGQAELARVDAKHDPPAPAGLGPVPVTPGLATIAGDAQLRAADVVVRVGNLTAFGRVDRVAERARELSDWHGTNSEQPHNTWS